MTTFDPLGLIEGRIPQKTINAAIRVIMALVCGGFLYFRIREYDLYYLKPLWFVETVIFAVLALAFFTRDDPVDRARGFKEIAIPLLGGVSPFFLVLSPPNPGVYQNEALIVGILWFMTLSTALTVWGMWTLRRAFSITVEARRLVWGGPYRFVRHPIYLGEIFASAGVMLWRFSVLNLIIFLLFFSIQLLRSALEEAKLKRNFPEYADTLNKRWWFFS